MNKKFTEKLIIFIVLFTLIDTTTYCMEKRKVRIDPSLELLPEKPNTIMRPSDEKAHLERNALYKEEKKRLENAYKFFQVNKNKRLFNPNDYDIQDLIDMYILASHELANNKQKIEKNSILLEQEKISLKNDKTKINTLIAKEQFEKEQFKKEFTIKCREDMKKRDSVENKKIKNFISKIDQFFQSSDTSETPKKIKFENQDTKNI